MVNTCLFCANHFYDWWDFNNVCICCSAKRDKKLVMLKDESLLLFYSCVAFRKYNDYGLVSLFPNKLPIFEHFHNEDLPF